MLFQSTSAPEQSGSVDTQQAVSFVESCLEREATNALYDVGQTGGSIEGLNFEVQPWRGEAFTNGPQEVKYWYHMESCGKEPGCIRFTPPPLCEQGSCVFDGQYEGAGESIQVTTQKIIEENIVSCVGDFSSTNFELLDQEQPQANVIFTADDVQVQLDYPLQLRNQETSELVTINDFSTSLDIDFEKTYRLARDIVALEFQTQFIENNLLHFMSLYQGDPPLLPPYSDTELFGGRKIWVRTQVEELLKEEILPYLSFMQIINAYQGYRPIVNTGVDDPVYGHYADGLFKYAEIEIPDAFYPRLEARFLYPFSDIYLNINDDEILKGQDLDTGNFFMKFAGIFMKTYKHNYDIAWPMISSVTDPEALGGEGYTLNFGIEANIVNNAPMTVNRTIITFDNRGSQPVDYGEPQHHAEGTITLQVTDKRTDQPVPEAELTYYCGWKYEIPRTTNAQGVWEGTLPYCAVGGYVEAKVPFEYYTGKTPLLSMQDDQEATVELWPFQKKNVLVYTLSTADLEAGCSVEDCRELLNWNSTFNYSFNGTNTTATENQYALIHMNKVPDEISEPVPLNSTVVFGKQDEAVTYTPMDDVSQHISELNLTQEEEALLEEQSQDALRFEAKLHEQHTVHIVPEEYQIEGLLFYEGNLTIPKAGKKPELQLPTWLQGGLSVEDLRFSEQDVYSDTDLVIYLLEKPLPTTWKELDNEPTQTELQETFPVIVRFE